MTLFHAQVVATLGIHEMESLQAIEREPLGPEKNRYVPTLE